MARFNFRFATTDVAWLSRYFEAFGQGGLAADGNGNIFVADSGNSVIRKVDATGTVTTVAGKAGVTGSTDGAAADARFLSPTAIVIDHSGNLFVADSGNNVIRRISTDHVVSTFAGTAGTMGSADGTGSAASFQLDLNPIPRTVWPACRGSLAIDPNDNLFVADCANNTIRKITPAAVVSTFAGTAGTIGASDGTGAAASFIAPVGLAADSGGNLYVADGISYTFSLPVNLIRMITPAGVVTTIAGTGQDGSNDGAGTAAAFWEPLGVAADPMGNVYVADSGNSTIRKIFGGVVTTIAGTVGKSGSSDGTGAAASFNIPSSLTCDTAGNVFVVDAGNNVIRKVTPAGVVSTVAGTSATPGSADGTGSAARFNTPMGIATDASGNVYVADAENEVIRKITPAGVTSVFAGTTGQTGSADGSAATFWNPTGVAVDGSGNVYVADSWNQAIRKITPAGVVSTLAGDPTANLIQGSLGPSSGGSTDGTGKDARFMLSIIPPPSPTALYVPFCQGALAVDQGGNVYVADCGNGTVRKVTPAGMVTTLAGTAGMRGSADGAGALLWFPQGIAVDASGNVYVADGHNNTIRKITAAGVVSTLAGTAGVTGNSDGTGSAASFNNPQGLAVGDSGNLYVADTGNHTIRKITPNGVVTTVVGAAGSAGFAPGSLPGLLAAPVGLSYAGGTLYVTTENAVVTVTAVP